MFITYHHIFRFLPYLLVVYESFCFLFENFNAQKQATTIIPKYLCVQWLGLENNVKVKNFVE